MSIKYKTKVLYIHNTRVIADIIQKCIDENTEDGSLLHSITPFEQSDYFGFVLVFDNCK